MKKNVLRFVLLFTCAIFQQGFSQFELEIAFPNLSFNRPVDLQNAGDGSDRIFVVEQRGVIRVFENNSNTASATTFLDIRGRVDDADNEQGLLGLAFHPDYETNGYFYVNYIFDPGPGLDRTRISRFKVSDSNPNIAEPDSEFVLLEFNQDFGNHNGGAIAFGPNDGHLYIAVGDGGSGGDPLNRAQDRRQLLGSILRIDVDNQDPDMNYAIPPGNPYAGNTDGFREEIFAYGMRNPWRISFDAETGQLWAGDVGQGAREEVDIIENGKNYGWRIMEGSNCFNPPSGCQVAGLELPVWEYGRSLGNSITGGYVYRGPGVPELQGQYIYGDFGSGRIWALDVSDINSPANSELLNTSLNIASFGIDEQSELYICAFNGNIYRFKPTTTGIPGEADAIPETFVLEQNFPNPFNPTTNIGFAISDFGFVELKIYDITGRLVIILVAENKEAGFHNFLWGGTDSNGISQPSGIYFYQLKIDKEVKQTRRMVMLK